MPMTYEMAFERLSKSRFRSRFKLAADDLAYIERVGIAAIERHAADFVAKKLAAAEPANDGKQTPMRGHPAFKAMHATACCCRSCMEKWWRVKRHQPLSEVQQRKAAGLIMAWIRKSMPLKDLKGDTK